jgi:protein-tyrosine phosphatase
MIHILFVCLGNICRSPSAEAVMKGLIERKKMSDRFLIDSAGTAGHHEGEESDPRTIVHAKKRGYEVTSISRPFLSAKDFEKFDYIVVMDDINYADLQSFRYPKKIFSQNLQDGPVLHTIHRERSSRPLLRRA